MAGYPPTIIDLGTNTNDTTAIDKDYEPISIIR